MNKNHVKINKKWNVLVLILCIILLNIVPNDEKNHDDIHTLQTPIASTAYYVNITLSDAQDVYVRGDFAYIAIGLDGLAIVNISDPTNLGVPVYKLASGDAQGVYVEGNYVYIAAGNTFFFAIDISDPTNPGIPVYGSPITHGNSVFVSGSYAYVADSISGLAIIDISIPSTPGAMIYAPSWTGDAYDVYIRGDYAYLATSTSGLAIIDISDPTNPGAPVFAPNWSGQAMDVFVSGDYAYIANNPLGLSIINVSDPTNPGVPIHKDTGGNGWGVYVVGDYAYLADFPGGLVIVDISDPTNPGTPIIEDRDDGGPYNIFVKGDYAYIPTPNVGLVIVHAREMFGPIITDTPSDLIVDFGYTGKNISWTATDRDPSNYSVELVGTGIVAGPTPWTNGTEITFNIPDGLLPGDRVFKITFTDIYDNTLSDSVTMTVRDTMDPIITSTPPDFTVVVGYSEANTSWTATDHTPDTYTVSLEGSGVVATATAWSSGTEITYDIPIGLAVGIYNYTINITDDFNNYITDTVTMTVVAASAAIPYGNFYLLFLFGAIISLLVIQKRRKNMSIK